jgi:hypothetical protein
MDIKQTIQALNNLDYNPFCVISVNNDNYTITLQFSLSIPTILGKKIQQLKKQVCAIRKMSFNKETNDIFLIEIYRGYSLTPISIILTDFLRHKGWDVMIAEDNTINIQEVDQIIKKGLQQYIS